MIEEVKKVSLTEDQAAFSTDHVKKIHFAAKTLDDLIKRGEIDPEYASVLLQNVNGNVGLIAKNLNVSTESSRISDMTRALNEARNKELEDLRAQLAGSSNTAASIAKISQLFDEVEQWWAGEGLGRWLRNTSVSKSGVVKFELWICLDAASDSFSETPVTDKKDAQQKLLDLQGDGWELHLQGRKGRDSELIDNDANRKKLVDLVTAKYPSAIIAEWNSGRISETDNAFSIRGCEILIRDAPGAFDKPQKGGE